MDLMKVISHPTRPRLKSEVNRWEAEARGRAAEQDGMPLPVLLRSRSCLSRAAARC
jgi:hypothetical protein